MANNEILFKPNSLILATSSCDDITSTEYKLFDTLLQRCQYNKGHGFRECELSAKEIREIVKSNDNSTIEAIKNMLGKFKEISLEFKLGSSFVSGYAIAEYSYNEDSDIFKCSMSNNVFTILMEYAEHGYAPIDLKITRKAKGYYTQKIYQLLRMWSRENQSITKTFTIEEIKKVCDIQNGHTYEDYRDFRRRVLDPAVKEITKKMNMDISYTPIRVARKVQKIELTFTDYEAKKYNFRSEDQILIGEDSKDIDSIDYMNLIDCKINQSVHIQFICDYPEYKSFLHHVGHASDRTLTSIGGKTINKKNYKYFKATLDSLLI